jgi:uncharacterized protein YciI
VDDALREKIEAIGSRFYKKTLWVVVTRPVDGFEALGPHLLEHLSYQIELEKTGVLFAAGPLTPGDAGAPSGEGLIILRASNEAEARAIADADPMHRAGVRRYTMSRWDVHEGRMQISIDLSDSSFRLD